MVKIFQFLRLSTKFLPVLRLSVNPIEVIEAIVTSLPYQVLHCRADAVAKLEYSRRVLNLVVCGHIEA